MPSPTPTRGASQRVTPANIRVGLRIGYPPFGRNQRATVLTVERDRLAAGVVICDVKFDDGTQTAIMIAPAGHDEAYYLLDNHDDGASYP